MIVVFTGRRPSGRGGDFPDACVVQVREHVKTMITALRPRLVIGSGAAGADLLVLEAALELAKTSEEQTKASGGERLGQRIVVTAGRRESFREFSVADIGGEWPELYDDILDSAGTHVVEMLDVQADDEGFAKANKKIIQLVGAESQPGEEVVCIHLAPRRPKSARRGRDLSADLSEAMKRRNVFVAQVATDVPKWPEAFVAMPFGKKDIRLPNGVTWTNYDSDVSYYRIFMPALIAAGFIPNRVDNDNMTDIIDEAMIRPLSDAKLVVADLTTSNPNVFWELGVRHGWSPDGTCLVGLQGSIQNGQIPFDVARVPVAVYMRSEDTVDEHDLVASLRALVPVFSRGGSASPIFSHFRELRRVNLDEPLDHERNDKIKYFGRRIDVETALRNTDALTTLAAEIESSPHTQGATRERLLGNIALALISLDYLDDAQRLLKPLARADGERRNAVLQQNYAHTLIRSEAGDRDAELAEAERLLRVLDADGPDGETRGLLGSVAKARLKRALAVGDSARVEYYAREAVKAYESGFEADPRAYYPGVNAVALYRLLGQHWAPNPPAADDLARAEEILPVVRFVVQRNAKGEGIWAKATTAELDLHEYLLGNPDPGAPAPRGLANTFAELGRHMHEHAQAASSFRRQLRLMRDAGDPKPLIDMLLLTVFRPAVSAPALDL